MKPYSKPNYEHSFRLYFIVWLHTEKTLQSNAMYFKCSMKAFQIDRPSLNCYQKSSTTFPITLSLVGINIHLLILTDMFILGILKSIIVDHQYGFIPSIFHFGPTLPSLLFFETQQHLNAEINEVLSHFRRNRVAQEWYGLDYELSTFPMIDQTYPMFLHDFLKYTTDTRHIDRRRIIGTSNNFDLCFIH